MRTRVFLGLGSNVGDRLGYIQRAVRSLSSFCRIGRVSTVYESDPWGVEKQPPFLNCVVEAYTAEPPFELLRRIKEAEKSLGRKERFRWGPREIDIDILLYGEEVIDEAVLKVPHPYIRERDFFLIPLLELEPELVSPEDGIPYREALTYVRASLRPYCCLLSGRPPLT